MRRNRRSRKRQFSASYSTARSNPLLSILPASEDQISIACSTSRAHSWSRRHRSFRTASRRNPTSPTAFPRTWKAAQLVPTAQLDETTTKKLYQFKNLAIPCVLAIASSHFGSPILLDAPAAMMLLVSQPFWVVGGERMSTDLKYSLFLRGEGEDIVAKNPDISAVLLVAIGADRSYVCGALHPSPTHPFDSKPLWEIPFAYLKDWPVEQNRLRTMWTLGSAPSPLEISHAAIK